MSEGRIPVSGLDIRQTTIKTPHLIDESVTTAKIADVAVTVEKTDEPTWTDTLFVGGTPDASLSTSFTELASVSFDIPSWVGLVAAKAFAYIRMANSSGGTQAVHSVIRFNGEDPTASSGSQFTDIASGLTGLLVDFTIFALSAPGATFSVELWGKVGSGTNSGNISQLSVELIGVR